MQSPWALTEIDLGPIGKDAYILELFICFPLTDPVEDSLEVAWGRV